MPLMVKTRDDTIRRLFHCLSNSGRAGTTTIQYGQASFSVEHYVYADGQLGLMLVIFSLGHQNLALEGYG